MKKIGKKIKTCKKFNILKVSILKYQLNGITIPNSIFEEYNNLKEKILNLAGVSLNPKEEVAITKQKVEEIINLDDGKIQDTQAEVETEKASQDLTNIYASKEQELELRTNFISKKVNIWENDIEKYTNRILVFSEDFKNYIENNNIFSHQKTNIFTSELKSIKPINFDKKVFFKVSQNDFIELKEIIKNFKLENDLLKKLMKLLSKIFDYDFLEIGDKRKIKEEYEKLRNKILRSANISNFKKEKIENQEEIQDIQATESIIENIEPEKTDSQIFNTFSEEKHFELKQSGGSYNTIIQFGNATLQVQKIDNVKSQIQDIKKQIKSVSTKVEELERSFEEQQYLTNSIKSINFVQAKIQNYISKTTQRLENISKQDNKISYNSELKDILNKINEYLLSNINNETHQSLVVLESFAKALLIMSNSEQKDTKDGFDKRNSEKKTVKLIENKYKNSIYEDLVDFILSEQGLHHRLSTTANPANKNSQGDGSFSMKIAKPLFRAIKNLFLSGKIDPENISWKGISSKIINSGKQKTEVSRFLDILKNFDKSGTFIEIFPSFAEAVIILSETNYYKNNKKENLAIVLAKLEEIQEMFSLKQKELA
ncbi:hypothetical protein BKN14_05745 [Candidatus Gracilibacteria bacterium HOT-871]|nr:hypothetical protein BKN14_05745 [Candidatus Gracilibacteria bacterium HOT-871]